MGKEVIFIQGGGEGAYEMDRKLVASLQQALGADYQVHYPRMPNEGAPDYTLWKGPIHSMLAALHGESILVGHSVGGYLLVKYVTQEPLPSAPIRGICLIATPYPGGDEQWQFEGFSLPEDFGRKFPANARIWLYHSPDDQTVPFAHMGLYAKHIPGATVRETAGGHQLNNDVAQVAQDIRATIS
ncbi:MAG TPA: alpha/beta fold hydrolase [Ktedonobacterales bacterium]|nr:alpha/beta fold hydrolase [Ktedonobacterales bacterium]